MSEFMIAVSRMPGVGNPAVGKIPRLSLNRRDGKCFKLRENDRKESSSVKNPQRARTIRAG
jgi:hypothetical protein